MYGRRGQQRQNRVDAAPARHRRLSPGRPAGAAAPHLAYAPAAGRQPSRARAVRGAELVRSARALAAAALLALGALALPTTARTANVSEGGTDLPGDTTTTGHVDVGGSVTGTISDSDEVDGDLDAFRVELQAGETYQFDLEGQQTSKGTLSDPYLELRDAGDSTLQEDDDSGEGRNRRLSYTPTSAGTYYLVAGSATSDTGTYTLSVSGPEDPDETNNAPEFTDATTVREVAENSAANTSVGAAVTATDDDADQLAYSLEGTDAASFTISSSSGQIATIAGVTYNYEAKSSYSVRVKADDGTDSDTIEVTIDLTDVPEQSAKPAKPTLAAVTGSSTSLVASWTEPGLNGGPAIPGYDVQYREGTSGAWTTFDHTGTAVTTTITGLTANTEYQVQVRALNGETPSAWSDPSDAVRTNAEGETPTAPTITSVEVTSTPSDSVAYLEGETIRFTVTFSAAVEVVGDPVFTFALGNRGDFRDVDAAYEGGSETIALVFAYTVLATDEDSNGISLYAGVIFTDSDGPVRLDADDAIIAFADGAGNNGVVVHADLTWTRFRQEEDHKVDGTGRMNRAPVFPEGDSTTRTVARSSLPLPNDTGSRGAAVGEPVLATDANDDELKYRLEGADEDLFHINPNTGQIRTLPPVEAGAADDLSYPRDSYQVRVIADDGKRRTDTIDMTIYFTGSVGPPPPLEPVTVTLHLSAEEVVEDSDAVTVTAAASPASATAFTVTVSASAVAPATAADFELSANRVLSFLPNATASTGTVTIAPVDDGDAEPTRVVTVSGSASIAGVTGPDDVTLRILDDDSGDPPPPPPPRSTEPPTVSVRASAKAVSPGGAVELTATASDPDGGPVTYAWSSPSGSFDARDGATATWTAPPAPGEVEIRVTVTDDEGDTASATVTVTVAGAPTVTVTAEPGGGSGGEVMLTATASDPDGGPVTYAGARRRGASTRAATATWTAGPVTYAWSSPSGSFDDEGYGVGRGGGGDGRPDGDGRRRRGRRRRRRVRWRYG